MQIVWLVFKLLFVRLLKREKIWRLFWDRLIRSYIINVYRRLPKILKLCQPYYSSIITQQLRVHIQYVESCYKSLPQLFRYKIVLAFLLLKRCLSSWFSPTGCIRSLLSWCLTSLKINKKTWLKWMKYLQANRLVYSFRKIHLLRA